MTISRRKFLKILSATGGLGLASQIVPEMAWAATGGNGTKLVMINLNGGLDGLAALQPLSGNLYTSLAGLRPTLALAPGQLLASDGTFGFHPTLTSFKSLYDEGSLTGVLNVGYNNLTRSHLEAEIVYARGVADRLSASSTGLINRIGSRYGWSSLQAMSVTGADPFFGGGEYRAVQANSLDDLYFRDFSDAHSDLEHLVASTFSFANESPTQSGKTKQADYTKNLEAVINTTDAVQNAVSGLPLSNVYANNQFGRAMRSAEIALRSSHVNSDIVYLRNGGFDTHSTQQARMNQLLTDFNGALGTFVTNMKAAGLWNNLIILIFSEFGRTNRENGSLGTDHGGANPFFLVGGPVNGGGFHGTINPTTLTNSGWLTVEYNVSEVYRRVLARMGLDAEALVPEVQGPTLTSLFN